MPTIKIKYLIKSELRNMKSRFLKSSLSIFIILLSLVTFIVRPIYMRLVSEISRYVDAYLALVTEKTELSISYKSLSPSILTRYTE